MRAIIQQIQENIFALPLPITPEAVLRIFSTYNNNLATLTLDTGFEGVCTELNVISQLAIEGQQLIDKRLDLTKTQEEHVRHAQLQIKLLEEKIELEHSIQTINVELNALFANLLPLINVLFLLKNPNKPPYASTDEIEKQCALVLDHNERLTRQLVANELPAIKLNLVRLKYRKTALLKEVNDLGLVHHGGGKLAWFKEVTVALTDEIAKYTELRPKLEQLQKKFANQLSEDDLQTKIGELQRRSLLLGKELQQLTERIKTNSLTPDIKLRLEDEFRKSTDINGLLSVYESKIDTIYSYVDLTSWISWLNDDYNKKQAEFKDSWHFLKLLLEQRNIQKETTDLSSQLQSLEQLLGVNGTPTANREFESYSTIPVPETGDSAKTDSSVSASLKDITAQGTLDDTILDNTETTQKSLIEEARQLINAIPSFINTQGLDLTSQASDFYLALLENIPLISQKIDKKTIILEKLKALVIVMTEIEQIREKYKLPEPSDNQLPSLEQLEREIPREEDKVKTQAEIARQKLLCSGYLDKARKLPILLKELRKTKCSLIAIPVELSKYTVPLDQQICALSSKLALLITDIEKKIAGMKSSSTSNMTKNIDSIAEVLVKVESPKGTTTVDTNLQQDDDTRLLLEMTITGDDGLIHPTHNPLVSYGTGESVIIEPIDDTVEHGGEQAQVTTLATDYNGCD